MYKTDSIAILLATYNGESFLREQITSLLTQTYDDFIIYISDDLSSDSTPLIISDFCNKFPSKIINIGNNVHFGNARDNFFHLLLQIDAPFYFFCDQDDVWKKDKINKIMSVYKKYEDEKLPLLIHSDLDIVDSDLNLINTSFMNYTKTKKIMNWKQYLVENNNVVGCSMGINNSLANLYKKNYMKVDNTKIFMHESFFAHLASLAGKILFIDESLVQYRQHGNNSIGAIKKRISFKLLREKLLSLKNGIAIQKNREENVNEIIKCCDAEFIDKSCVLLCEKYSSLYKKNKMQRIIFLIRNHIYRKSILDTLYLFLTI